MYNISKFKNWEHTNESDDEYQNPNEFKEGDYIRHIKEGDGIITEIKPITNSNGKDTNVVTIEFGDGNTKSYDLNDLLKTNSLYPTEEKEEQNYNKSKKKLRYEDIEIEEEEEEEYEDVDDDTEYEDLTEEELMVMKMNEFFDKSEIKNIISLDDVLVYRKKLTEKLYSYKDLNPFQKQIIGRRIAITYIIERYFNYLKEIFPYGKIYRYVGKIDYDELWDLRKRERVPFYKEMHDIHGFDNGIVYYWVFNDGVLFKTI
jgi:hypothetical protein